MTLFQKGSMFPNVFSSPSSGDKLLAGSTKHEKFKVLFEFSSPSSGDKLLAEVGKK